MGQTGLSWGRYQNPNRLGLTWTRPWRGQACTVRASLWPWTFSRSLGARVTAELWKVIRVTWLLSPGSESRDSWMGGLGLPSTCSVSRIMPILDVISPSSSAVFPQGVAPPFNPHPCHLAVQCPATAMLDVWDPFPRAQHTVGEPQERRAHLSAFPSRLIFHT